MGDRLGNMQDLKHRCQRHGVSDPMNKWLEVGAVEQCECGRRWVLIHATFGRRWTPLRGRRKRRFDRAIRSSEGSG